MFGWNLFSSTEYLFSKKLGVEVVHQQQQQLLLLLLLEQNLSK